MKCAPLWGCIANLVFFLSAVTQNKRPLSQHTTLICWCVLVMLSDFFLLSTHVGRFFGAIRPICCTGSSPSLERRGEELEATYPPPPLHPPLHGPTYVQEGEVNAEVERVCVCVSLNLRVNACKEGSANQSSTRYLFPLQPLFGLLHLPPQWFLLQYKSQPALLALTYTRAHTHQPGRQTSTHTHTSANPLTTRQCPEQIKRLHISNCIPNVPPLHGSSSSSSCTFSSSS